MRQKDSIRADDQRMRLRKILERVKVALSMSDRRYVLLRFPSKYKERSIDIIALDSSGSKRNMIIRIKLRPKVSKEEVSDLRKASVALNAVPIIVADDDELYDNIVYEKDGVFILNDRTLENICSRPGELIALYRKGELYLSLNKSYLASLRSKEGMSLSEISYLTGISRRTIFEYEREGGLVSIEVADRLVTALGEDIIRSVDLDVMFEEFSKRVVNPVSEESEERLESIETIRRYLGGEDLEVFSIRKSAPDFLVKKESEVSAVVDAFFGLKRFTVRELVKKTTETIKLTSLLRGRAGIIVSDKEVKDVIVDEVSTITNTNKLEIMKPVR